MCRDINDDGWIRNSAAEAIQRLMEIQELKPLDDAVEEDETKMKYVIDSFQDDDRGSLEDSEASSAASKGSLNTETVTLDTKSNPLESIVEASEERVSSREICANNAPNATESLISKQSDEAETEFLGFQVNYIEDFARLQGKDERISEER